MRTALRTLPGAGPLRGADVVRTVLLYGLSARVDELRSCPARAAVAARLGARHRAANFCVDDYAPHARAHLGVATWQKVRKYQVATLVEFFGDYRLTELTAALIDAYKASRVKDSIRASSVNNELRVLGTMLRWAREERALPVADFRIRRLPVSHERRVHAWSAAEVARLYAACSDADPRLAPLLAFMLNTGARKGEAIAAEWSWVDDARRMFSIPVTEAWRPKNRRPREIPIGKRCTRTAPQGGSPGGDGQASAAASS